ncbi:hypothetical protein E2542_SST26757 [Spatholobus suberectus]|nr:hypothetical protein E2542_SST26757 [Spatholobus suberectus]
MKMKYKCGLVQEEDRISIGKSSTQIDKNQAKLAVSVSSYSPKNVIEALFLLQSSNLSFDQGPFTKTPTYGFLWRSALRRRTVPPYILCPISKHGEVKTQSFTTGEKCKPLAVYIRHDSKALVPQATRQRRRQHEMGLSSSQFKNGRTPDG